MEVFVVFFAVAFGILMPLLFVAHRKRILEHKERMALIEKGLATPEIFVPLGTAMNDHLYRAIVWIAVGITGMLVLPDLLGWQFSLDFSEVEHRLETIHRLRQKGVSEAQLAYLSIPPQDRFEWVRKLSYIPFGVGIANLVMYGIHRYRLRAEAHDSMLRRAPQ